MPPPSGFSGHVDQMLQVTVSLPSGHSTSLSIPQCSTVGDLKTSTQESLGKHFLRLVTSEGQNLNNPSEALWAAGLDDGDQLTAIVGQAKLAATESTFALWCCAGDGVVTWGYPQDQGPESAEECAAGSGFFPCICCHLGRWLRCHLGLSTGWR